jgi:hypothetical protein
VGSCVPGGGQYLTASRREEFEEFRNQEEIRFEGVAFLEDPDTHFLQTRVERWLKPK